MLNSSGPLGSLANENLSRAVHSLCQLDVSIIRYSNKTICHKPRGFDFVIFPKIVQRERWERNFGSFDDEIDNETAMIKLTKLIKRDPRP